MAKASRSTSSGSTSRGRSGGARRDDRHGLRGINRSTMMMGLMFLAGLGWVAWESQKVGVYKPTAEAKQHETLVAAGLNDMMRIASRDGKADVSRMIETFYYDAKQRQVPIERMGTNPFALDLPEEVKPAPTTKPDDDDVDPPPPPPEETAPSKDKLVLHMVHVIGGVPHAVMSGAWSASPATVRIGDRVDGWTIEGIEADSVRLRWKDETFVLSSQMGKKKEK